MNLCFLVLAHDRPEQCARLLVRLLNAGAQVALHLDRKASPEYRDILRDALGHRHADVLWAESVDVGWGQWSMVEATLNGLRAIQAGGHEPDYVYLISGADYPIRPLGQLRDFLARNAGQEFIESVDAEARQWVIRGLQQDRYRYRHWVSWKRHPRVFDWLLRLQRCLRLDRPFPRPHHPHMGSQWWTLTWKTCRAILELARDPALVRFFRTTWVPDELFFQTLVRSVVSEPGRVDGRHLTLYEFTPYGVPVVFYNGHQEHVLGQPFFFARKLSPFAAELRDAIDARLTGPQCPAPPPDDEVGRLPPTYAEHLERHAGGLPGRRVMCRPDDPVLGALAWNDRPYFVISADSREALRAAQSVLDTRPGVMCHGELLADDRIYFAGGAESMRGYRADDLPIRDQSPQNFIADIVQTVPGVLPGYLLHTPGAMLEVHDIDPNCHLVRLESADLATLRATLEAELPAPAPGA